jgi:hypothetical protein
MTMTYRRGKMLVVHQPNCGHTKWPIQLTLAGPDYLKKNNLIRVNVS